MYSRIDPWGRGSYPTRPTSEGPRSHSQPGTVSGEAGISRLPSLRGRSLNTAIPSGLTLGLHNPTTIE